MDIRAISVLQEYIADMPEPRKKCKKQIFLQETYSRWAAEEILRCIQENRSRPPVAVVEEFKENIQNIHGYVIGHRKNITGIPIHQ